MEINPARKFVGVVSVDLHLPTTEDESYIIEVTPAGINVRPARVTKPLTDTAEHLLGLKPSGPFNPERL